MSTAPDSTDPDELVEAIAELTDVTAEEIEEQARVFLEEMDTPCDSDYDIMEE